MNIMKFFMLFLTLSIIMGVILMILAEYVL